MVPPKCKSRAALVMGFIECFLFGASVLTGWPSLVFVFKQEGVFRYLCDTNSGDAVTTEEGNRSIATTATTVPVLRNLPMADNIAPGWPGVDISINSTNGSLYAAFIRDLSPGHDDEVMSEPVSCPARDQRFGLVFTLTLVLSMVSNVLLGAIFDVLGTRALRIIAILLFIPGGFLFVFASEVNSWMIFPGAVFMSIAGSCVIITNTHLSLLAGNRKSTVATLYSGAVDSSLCVFLVIKVLWENGVSGRVLFCINASLWSIVIFNTFVLFPKFKVKVSPKFGDVKQKRASQPQVVTSLKQCLSSSAYYLHVAWYCLLVLRIGCFFSYFNIWINTIADNDTEKVSFMTDVFHYILFLGIIFSPLLGLSMDWCKNRLFASTTSLAGNAFAAMPVLFFGSIMAILLSTSMLIQNEYSVYISFVFFVAFKSSTFGIYHAYFNLAVPQKHYGLLLGLGSTCAGTFSTILYPLVIWAENSPNGFLSVNVFLLVMTVCCLIHPINLCIQNRKRKPMIVRHAEQNTTEMKLLNNHVDS